MNKSFFIGNLTADAVLRTVNVNGEQRKVTNFTLAENSTRNGQQYTTFVRVAAWGNMTNLAPYLTKGRKVAVVGRVSASYYTANDGTIRPQLELTAEPFGIELEGSSNQNTGVAARMPAVERTAEVPNYDAPAPGAEAFGVEADELPF